MLHIGLSIQDIHNLYMVYLIWCISFSLLHMCPSALLRASTDHITSTGQSPNGFYSYWFWIGPREHHQLQLSELIRYENFKGVKIEVSWSPRNPIIMHRQSVSPSLTMLRQFAELLHTCSPTRVAKYLTLSVQVGDCIWLRNIRTFRLRTPAGTP